MSDVPTVRLYAPSIVLLLWAALWALGVKGDGVIVCGLAATAGACVVSVFERADRRGPDAHA